MQEGLKFILLVGLRLVVGRPILRIGGALRCGNRDTLGHGRAAIGVLLAFHYEAGRKNVLAIYPACFMVGAGTRGDLGHQVRGFVFVTFRASDTSGVAFWGNGLYGSRSQRNPY